MSLRAFHLIFILIAIVGADLFGAWSLWAFRHTGDVTTLVLGLISIVGGVGLVFYVIRMVRFMQEAHIE